MDYCIKNSNNVYIKLNKSGCPVTCVEANKGVFAFSKAKNLLACLPKSLKRFNFQIEAIPEIKPKEEIKEEKILENQTYVVSEDISRWVDKFGKCADILNEAKQREVELIEALHRNDNAFLDVLHIIEMEKSKDMFSGWKLYKSIKDIRERRRRIKDELIIVDNILREINPSCLQREKVQKAINGLFYRKYKFRVVEECDEHADL